MPLPLPNLDTRSWQSLVDEGRALIPSSAPAWTDHNVSDPGITLIDVFAWRVEAAIYRANRVPERHRRKFLALVGFPPAPPAAAITTLALTLVPATPPMALPAGCTFTAPVAGAALPFRLRAPITAVAGTIAAVQTFDGARFVDVTRALLAGQSVPPFGTNPAAPGAGADPESAPALYVGLDTPLPPGVTVSLAIGVDPRATAERARIAAEGAAQAAACQAAPPRTCDGATPPPAPPPPSSPSPATMHHSVHTAWEYWTGTTWRALDPTTGAVDDTTRGLTLGGGVDVTVPAPMSTRSVGVVTTALYYLRCRFIAGAFDAAPTITGVWLNAVDAEQRASTVTTFRVGSGVTPSGTITVGTTQPLDLVFAADGTITAITVGATGASLPLSFIAAYTPATLTAPGAITMACELPGFGTGWPAEQFALRSALVAGGTVALWIREPAGWTAWSQRADFDSAGATDAVFVLAATTGMLTFGRGDRGRVVPPGAAVLVAYDATVAGSGNVLPHRAWTLADSPINRALLGGPVASVAARLGAVDNPAAGAGGATQETVDHAAGRAAATLWAHERLLEIVPADGSGSLDQVDPAVVGARPAPERASTVADIERIALDTPGTVIRRARAWPGIDPMYPGSAVAGTVTLVIVPGLPVGRPEPSAGLLRAVRRHLGRRRVLCTRLVVIGPSYRTVTVTAVIGVVRGADPPTVQRACVAALTTFIDPLVGGPHGFGWPFGRPVYRSDVFRVIDAVAGVEHVVSLALSADDGPPQCGDVCVPPTWLVISGPHAVEARSP